MVKSSCPPCKGKKPAASRASKSKPAEAMKRHRAVLRDNIQGVSDPALRRLLRRGGVRRISALVYEELRGILKKHLESVLRDAVTYVEHARRKTLDVKDLVDALERQGKFLAAGAIKLGGEKHISFEGVNKSATLSRPPKVHAAGATKSHKFRPGVVALREIQRLQKTDHFLIRRLPFVRLVREIVQDFGISELRFSKAALEGIQLCAENYIVSLSEDAQLCAIHAHRVSVTPADFQLAQRIRGERA